MTCLKAGSERRTSKWPVFVLRHTKFQNLSLMRSTSIALCASVPLICCRKTNGSASFRGRSTQAAEPNGMRPNVVGLPAAIRALRNWTVRVLPSYLVVTPCPPRTISGNQPGGSICAPVFLCSILRIVSAPSSTVRQFKGKFKVKNKPQDHDDGSAVSDRAVPWTGCLRSPLPMVGARRAPKASAPRLTWWYVPLRALSVRDAIIGCDDEPFSSWLLPKTPSSS
jgi:hypothetical protein